MPRLRRIRWTYRLRQFLRQVRAISAPDNARLASEVLSGEALVLFERMSAGDQIHALCVLAEMRASSHRLRQPLSPHVEQAALLHDVGKAGVRLTVWHRGTATLLQAIAPEWLERLSIDDAHSWRYPFHVQLHHASIGARLCESAGCSTSVVSMVRFHEASAEELEHAVKEPLLQAEILALQEADDVS